MYLNVCSVIYPIAEVVAISHRQTVVQTITRPEDQGRRKQGIVCKGSIPLHSPVARWTCFTVFLQVNTHTPSIPSCAHHPFQPGWFYHRVGKSRCFCACKTTKQDRVAEVAGTAALKQQIQQLQVPNMNLVFTTTQFTSNCCWPFGNSADSVMN